MSLGFEDSNDGLHDRILHMQTLIITSTRMTAPAAMPTMAAIGNPLGGSGSVLATTCGSMAQEYAISPVVKSVGNDQQSYVSPSSVMFTSFVSSQPGRPSRRVPFAHFSSKPAVLPRLVTTGVLSSVKVPQYRVLPGTSGSGAL